MIFQFTNILGKTLSYIASWLLALFILHRDEYFHAIPLSQNKNCYNIVFNLNHVEFVL